ncbi:MAG TPA: vitamin K epoxide reductase family protein, partial [Kofleriaceae bacterium]|nr:vitamin K epoxide reductase family protein [Kofleriaceae bacterium]
MRPPGWLVAVLVGAFAGLVFAGVSTYDFVQHLDRQVHSLHCSFIPGAGAETGASGCQAAMMSPYSSVFRTSIWGGIPISLPAMAVFAFILFYSLDLLLGRRKDDPRATAFLALACALPALASVLMLTISLTKLGAICKLCAGVYISSALCLTGAIVLWRRAARPAAVGTSRSGASLEVQVEAPPTSNGFLGAMFGIGVLFVAVPVVMYAVMAPDHGKFIGTCGQLDKPDDTYGVMVPVQRGGSTPALEILDPLCPACKAFEQRLAATGLASRLDRRAILFPLDTTCNWMITENTHPGACTVSEAVLCAGDKAPEVIRWAFEVQDRVRAETKADPGAAERIVKQRFPELASCIGSPEARSRLNQSLRWSVANNIRVLTPQLFVDKVK